MIELEVAAVGDLVFYRTNYGRLRWRPYSHEAMTMKTKPQLEKSGSYGNRKPPPRITTGTFDSNSGDAPRRYKLSDLPDLQILEWRFRSLTDAGNRSSLDKLCRQTQIAAADVSLLIIMRVWEMDNFEGFSFAALLRYREWLLRILTRFCRL
jgi:hypothetical protein